MKLEASIRNQMFWQAQQGQLSHLGKICLILNFKTRIKADSVNGTFLVVKGLGTRLAMQGSIPDPGTKFSHAVEPPSLQATTTGTCSLWTQVLQRGSPRAIQITPHGATKITGAATKTQQSQINKFLF